MKNHFHLSLKDTVADCERRHIRLALNACKNDKVEAAKVLKIGMSSLYRKINKYKLKGDKK